jgi:hypothetical protein
MSHE